MTVRTVRLDDDAERMLTEVQEATGLSTSEILRHGLSLAHQEVRASRAADPYAIYAELDLGPGGYVQAPARKAKTAARSTARRRRGR